MNVNTPARPDSNRSLPSAVPYAVLSPILAVMAHSAWMVQRGAFPSSLGLLVGIFIDPLVLFGMVAVVMLAFTFIRPLVVKALSRWLALLSCVAVLTLALKLLIPELTR